MHRRIGTSREVTGPRVSCHFCSACYVIDVFIGALQSLITLFTPISKSLELFQSQSYHRPPRPGNCRIDLHIRGHAAGTCPKVEPGQAVASGLAKCVNGRHSYFLLIEYGLARAVSETQVLCGGIITSLNLLHKRGVDGVVDVTKPGGDSYYII